MGKSKETYDGKHIELPDDIYKLQQQDGLARTVINTTKVIGLIVLVAAIAVTSAIAPIGVVIVASIVLTVGYLAFAGDDYGPQGCLTALWGVVKYVLLLAILLMAFYTFMMVR